MTRPIPRTALALSLALLGSPLLAAPGRQAQPRTAPAASKASAHKLWDRLVALWGAAGCIGDPDGVRCAAATKSTSSPLTPRDAGCVIDPNGLCASER